MFASTFFIFHIGWHSNIMKSLLAIAVLIVTLSLALRVAFNGSLGAKVSGFRSTRTNAVLLAWPLGLSIFVMLVANLINGDFTYLEAEGPLYNSVAFMASPLGGGVMICGRLMIYFLLRLELPAIKKINNWEASIVESTDN